MEAKTAKITTVNENFKNYTGQNGVIYVHGIMYEGSPLVWEYHSVNPICKYFRVNEVITFEFETQVNGHYTNHRIKPVKIDTPKPTTNVQAQIAYLSCLNCAAQYLSNKAWSADFQDVIRFGEKAFDAMNKKING